jgi:hypothetical protein
MASSSIGVTHHSFDLINGRWIIPQLVTSDREFRLLWTAYEGRNRRRFLRGERGSRTDIPTDLFLKLVTGQIKSTNPFSTLSQAITFYGFCNAVREQDFDLLKRIIDFLLEYEIISLGQHSQLKDEICRRIPAKRAAETIRLARAQRAREEALARQRAEREEEEFWNSPEVEAEVARAEVAHQVAPPAQELVVLAGPPGGAESGAPPVEPLERGHSPSRVRISGEELALIVAFRQALDKKERINWQAYRGLKEFDRLCLEAILDLADLVEGDYLPCAQIVPASELTPIVYARLGRTTLTPETLRSGIFYPRN